MERFLVALRAAMLSRFVDSCQMDMKGGWRIWGILGIYMKPTIRAQ